MKDQFSKCKDQFDELQVNLQEIRLKMDQIMIKAEMNLQICESIIGMLRDDDDTKKTN